MKERLLKSQKYLLFSMTERKTGVDNIFRMLNLIFKEARLLGRIPVVGQFTMSPNHNLGNLKTGSCFADYLDLSNGVTSQMEGMQRKQIASHLDWMPQQDLDLTNYAPDQVYTLADNEMVRAEMNRRYDILIRRDPTFQYVMTFAKYKCDFLIDFPYSKKVNKLTDIVLDVLGISREHAIAAQHYFLSKINDIQSGGNHDMEAADVCIPANAGYYACMHIRTSDRKDWPIFVLASAKKQIKSVLEHTIAKGTKLYIMSDMHQTNFFDFLKADYQIYRYHDFPELTQLVANKDGNEIDNVMLYLVEKNIMRHALVKILPPHKGPMIYHLNTVYNAYTLKNRFVLKSFSVIKRNIIEAITNVLARLKPC